jgi:hypothetical protein
MRSRLHQLRRRHLPAQRPDWPRTYPSDTRPVGAAAPHAGTFDPQHLSQQDLVVMDAQKREYRIERQPLGRLWAADRA